MIQMWMGALQLRQAFYRGKGKVTQPFSRGERWKEPEFLVSICPSSLATVPWTSVEIHFELELFASWSFKGYVPLQESIQTREGDRYANVLITDGLLGFCSLGVQPGCLVCNSCLT